MSRVMGRLVRLLDVIAVAVGVGMSSAQGPPNLAGTWTLILETTAPAAAPGRGAPDTAGSGWGREITITQDAAALTIERAQFSRYDMQTPLRFVYALDGSESRNVIRMGRGPQEQTSRAAWKGAALVITTRHAPVNQPAARPLSSEVTHVFSLDASGNLVIETTRAESAGAASTTKARYTKS